MLRLYRTCRSYRSSKTHVVTQKGETELCSNRGGLHPGSAPSPLLCNIIMGVLTENIEISKDPPWAMMFAYDLVLCAMTSEEVGEDLENCV